MTRPVRPRSRPATTTTRSPFLIFIQSTSGASEMIRMNRFSRNSRPTGPKMRVPRGSPPSLIRTAAFSSKRIYEPSARRRSLRVRTTTALTTSPFLTPAPGSASLTVPTMTSPMPAYRRPLPPSTRIHKISFAPVLSATLSRDSCWITSTPASSRRGFRPAVRSYLLGLLQDFGHSPALGGGQRPSLHQQHAVTDATGVLLVVCLVLLGTAQNLAVLRVLHAVFHEDNDCLVHLVADHKALADLAVAALLVGGSVDRRRFGCVSAHYSASSSTSSDVSSSTSMMMPSSRSRITV